MQILGKRNRVPEYHCVQGLCMHGSGKACRHNQVAHTNIEVRSPGVPWIHKLSPVFCEGLQEDCMSPYTAYWEYRESSMGVEH